MGKSKFPGKPSKLAGKKKIRILSQAEISNQQQNGATTTTTTTATAAASNNVSVSQSNHNSPNFLEQVKALNGIKHQRVALLHNVVK